MSLKVCVLASGSSGNCIYVASESTKILIDAGISCKETVSRLASINVELSDIQAVCVSHEHGDHTSALGVLQRKAGMAIYANSGAVEALERGGRLGQLQWSVFTTGALFEIGDLKISPFSVPHDSYDPVGFIIESGDERVGIITDMGTVTELIKNRLKDCQTVVVEFNHDVDILQASDRPWSLKQRISGRQGHLSNNRAAELLAEIAGSHLKTVFLAHLSSDCNDPSIAMAEARKALEGCGCEHVDVKLTYQSRVSEMSA